MAASDEFPRGWRFTQFVGLGGALSLTVPAIVGVIHVLDGYLFRALTNGVAVPVSYTITVTTSGNYNNTPFDEIFVPTATDSAETSKDGSGLIQSEPGGVLTVSIAAATNVAWLGNIYGHDI